MTRLLHIASSPRGAASASLQIADAFLDAYRLAHPEAEIETWDLWDGSLPAFGPAAAGATAVIQPGGSMRDDEVIRAADEAGLAMVFTGHRHFRH